MDCSTVKVLMRLYFNKKIPLDQKDEIISHIIACRKCRAEYKEYAKAIGVKFNVISEVQKIYAACEANNIEPSKLYDLIKQGSIDERVVNRKDKYTHAAREKNVEVLTQIKCVADFFREELSTEFDDESIKRASEFGWWKVEQMCKTVDSLEGLFKMSAVGSDLTGGDDNV